MNNEAVRPGDIIMNNPALDTPNWADRGYKTLSAIGAEEEPDMVNRPPHYTEGRKIEPIDVIEDWGLGFHLGQVIRYVARAGRKWNRTEDLKKGRWYLDREISRSDD